MRPKNNTELTESKENLNKQIVLSVFFCGTGCTANKETTQIGSFAKAVEAIDITNSLDNIGDNTTSQYKMAFDGCAVTHGLLGLIFAHGLSDQVNQVISRAQYFLNKGKKIKLMAVGFSRGGIACIYLANKLAKLNLDPSQIQLNLFVFDPVPGNLITTNCLDFGWFSTASKSMLLTKSAIIHRVRFTYTNVPMDPLRFHAPVYTTSRSKLSIKRYILLGCHDDVLKNYQYSNKDKISFFLIQRFLLSANISFDFSTTKLFNMDLRANLHKKSILKILQAQCESIKYPEKKEMHIYPASAAVIKTNPNGKFLNLLHHELKLELKDKHTDENNIKENETSSESREFKLSIKITPYTYPKYTTAVGLMAISTGGLGLWAAMSSTALAGKIALIIGVATLALLWPIAIGVGSATVVGAGVYYLHRRHNIFGRAAEALSSCVSRDADCCHGTTAPSI